MAFGWISRWQWSATSASLPRTSCPTLDTQPRRSPPSPFRAGDIARRRIPLLSIIHRLLVLWHHHTKTDPKDEPHATKGPPPSTPLTNPKTRRAQVGRMSSSSLVSTSSTSSSSLFASASTSAFGCGYARTKKTISSYQSEHRHAPRVFPWSESSRLLVPPGPALHLFPHRPTSVGRRTLLRFPAVPSFLLPASPPPSSSSPPFSILPRFKFSLSSHSSSSTSSFSFAPPLTHPLTRPTDDPPRARWLWGGAVRVLGPRAALMGYDSLWAGIVLLPRRPLRRRRRFFLRISPMLAGEEEALVEDAATLPPSMEERVE
ncbi:hypothetical protein R3P38DRAFT_3438373 [Favolaschia claudopus]|uniref:Uncharacterized protein n=1 Tax=Favolaschia claudopus TaxID=2862362 RepID=A0AAV9ZSU2_9AGAR